MSSSSRADNADKALRVMRASFQETAASTIACTVAEIRAATGAVPVVVRFVVKVAIEAVLLNVGRDRPVLMSGI